MSASIFDLPPEILEIILKDLNLKEIGNCALTCEGMKQKVMILFRDKSKFLITSGADRKENPCPFEVIDLAVPNLKCELAFDVEDIPKRTGGIGGLIQNNLIIGGGFINTHGVGCGEEFFMECFIIGQKGPGMELLEMRDYSRSIVLGDKIWIVGGEKPPLHLDLQVMGKDKLKLHVQDFMKTQNVDNNPYLRGLIEHKNSRDTYLNSTEYIRLNQETEKGPKLPFRISSHAMVKVNETTVYIVGGKDEGGWETDETWIVDFSNEFKVKRGPELIRARFGHSCAIMKINGETILVVVGGDHVGNEDVELLDLSEPDPCWKTGRYNFEIFFYSKI